MASYSEWLREKSLLTAGIFPGQQSKFGLGDFFFLEGGVGRDMRLFFSNRRSSSDRHA